jgi:hypothetical protein
MRNNVTKQGAERRRRWRRREGYVAEMKRERESESEERAHFNKH